MSIETMTKLSTITVGVGGAASIDFTNIPQNYTDLLIKVSSRATTTNNEFNLTFNGISTGYIGSRVLYSTGSAAGSYTGGTTFIDGSNTEPSNYTASIFASADIYISQYSGYNPKVVSIESVQENNATASINQIGAGMLNNPLPITRITLTRAFDQHSTATLYGIKNARAAAGNSIKATGGVISFDGTYVTHTFTSSGTFTPTVELVADYLVVAGGGGGGGAYGSYGNAGGGGAGGYRTTVGTSGANSSAESRLNVSANVSYLITVGSGGAGGTGSNGTKGTDSFFSTIVSSGGGAGSNVGTTEVMNGGSGGGGAWNNSVGGTGIANQGRNGGTGFGIAPDSTRGGAGGGGASGLGGNASNSTGGNGGSGLSNFITGVAIALAGGGGGGGNTRGTATHGGGNGGQAGNASNATANTGGGGGGSANGGSGNTIGGNGGSGIVIIRYKAQ